MELNNRGQRDRLRRWSSPTIYRHTCKRFTPLINASDANGLPPSPQLRLTVHIVHRRSAGIPPADGIGPRSDGREVTVRPLREDIAELIANLGVQVDLGDGRDDLVAWV